jgi:uncharacterized protein YmfQ (DUF2313 family)
MAFEDVYASVYSTSYSIGYYDSVNNLYADMLQSLLPNGPAWTFETSSEMYALLRALSYSYLRSYYRAQDLLEEYDPRNTFDLLSDWERILNLPGTNPTPATSLVDRRAAVHAKLLGYGDPTPAFFEQLAAGLGFYVHILTTPYDPFVAGSFTGLPLIADEWAYVWEVYAWPVEETTTNTALLEWTIESLCPDHTLVLFRYYLQTDPVAGGSANLNAVAYDEVNTQWCAVGAITGANVYILTSPNALTWTSRSIASTAALNSIAHNGVDLWVAVGEDSAGDSFIVTSPDAQTWTERAPTVARAIDLKSVCYGNGLWVAVGNKIGGDGYILTSTDGTTWTEQVNPLDENLYAVCYGNGMFVAVGDQDHGGALYGYIITSTNGIAWTRRANPKNVPLYAIAYKEDLGLYCAVGENDGTDAYIVTSPDGINWTEQANPITTSALSAITAANDRFVVVGPFVGIKSIILISRDGITWTQETNPGGGDLNGVSHDEYGRFLAVGDDIGAKNVILIS